MPATLAFALCQLVKPSKNVGSEKWRKSLIYSKLRREYSYRSLMGGIITAGISYLAYAQFGTEHLGWILFLFWMLLLLAEIDSRMYLLPDIITIPLLVCGFMAAAAGWGLVTPLESGLGALAGYFLPSAVSLLFVWRNKDAFGGGDIKLLAALGAWLGLEVLLYVIIISAVLFGLYALIKKQRSGAYGPALAVAAIIAVFYFF